MMLFKPFQQATTEATCTHRLLMSESQSISSSLNPGRVEKLHVCLYFSFLLHLVNYTAGQQYSLIVGQLLKEPADLQFTKRG